MSNQHPKTILSSNNPFRWESSIPDYLKSPSKSIKSAIVSKRRLSLVNNIKKSDSFSQDPINKMPTVQSSPLDLKSNPPCYSIKYLGVTKGQIGILSKRAPIPYMSPLDTCKDVPLTLINHTGRYTKASNRILNKILSEPIQTVFKPDPPEILIEKVSEEKFPSPEAYDEYVIHTYARPKALVTIHKEDSYESNEVQHKPVQIPYHRVGISGWKLSRPKSSKPQSSNGKKKIMGKAEKKHERKMKKFDLPEYYNEPYLKFLAEKKSKNVYSKS